MPPFLFNDPNHWRERAEQMRLFAKGVDDPASKKIMPTIADQYEKPADLAEIRTDGKK